jgi:hypothetical protein
LSQAAAAADGLLVLLLADEGSFHKAQDALVNRWIANPEWSKSVASVALAYPLQAPVVRSIVYRYPNALAASLQEHIFPDSEAIPATAANGEENARRICGACGIQLVESARFCSNCGQKINSQD